MNQETYIVIVTFNAIKWAKRCFDSIKDAGLINRTIVVDNASTDGTIDFIRTNYPAVDIHSEKENLGFGKGNNIGISRALNKGADYIFLLNQDAYIDPNTVSDLISIASQNPEFGILSPLQLNENGRVDHLFASYLKESNVNSDSNATIERVNFCNAALWLVPKDTFLKVGGFDPVFPHYGEDKDFVNRVTYHQLKVGVCPQVHAIHDRDSSIIQPVNKRKYFEYISYLVDLKNPETNFKKTLAQVLKTFRKYLLLETFKFQFTRRKLDVKHRKMILDSLGTIKKHRELCLTKGPHFLKVK